MRGHDDHREAFVSEALSRLPWAPWRGFPIQNTPRAPPFLEAQGAITSLKWQA